MSVESLDAGAKLRVGNVLRGAWRLLAGNILFFLAVSVLVYTASVVASRLAVRLLAYAIPDLNLLADPERVVPAAVFLAVILPLGFNMVGQAVLLPGAVQQLRGRPLRIGETLHKALARGVPLLGLVLAWGLAFALCVVATVLILSAVVWGFVDRGMMPSLYSADMLAPFLFLASLVPSAILLVLSAVAVPACVVEMLGPLASLLRSTALTTGYRWRIFGIVLCFSLLAMGGNIIIATIAPARSALATVIHVAWFVP